MTLAVPELGELQVPPAFVWRPPRQRSMAPQLAQLAEALGRPLDPEQVFAADVLTGTRADGRAASLGAAIIAPRQNIKSWLFELIALGRLLSPGGDRLVVWSAHEVKTAQESFTDLQLLVDQHRWLRRRVTKVIRANGKEGIEFAGGRRLQIRARIKTGGRGLTGDCVFLDEAFALTPAHMGSLLPILSTRSRAAVYYGSSAGLLTSEVLRGIRDRGRRGGRGAPAYVEWCVPGSLLEPGCQQPKCLHAPGTPGCTLDREDLWIMSNLAAYPGRRIGIEYLREERGELPPAEFARERLGWWDEDGGSLVTIPVASWELRADPRSRIAGQRAIAFDITPDRKVSAIAGAGWRDDDAKHLALIEHRAGTSWLVPRLLQLVDKHDPAAVVVDGASPAATEIEALKQAGLRLRTADSPRGQLVVLGASDMARACGSLYDAIAGDEPDAWHRGDPVLQTALRGAARRPMGDGGWAFGRRTSTADISPIVAVAEAHYGLTTTAPDRGPLMAWR